MLDGKHITPEEKIEDTAKMLKSKNMTIHPPARVMPTGFGNMRVRWKPYKH